MTDTAQEPLSEYYRSLMSSFGETIVELGDIVSTLGQPCSIPSYIETDDENQIGDGWELQNVNVPAARGYFSGVVPCPPNPVLTHHGEVFMSVTPLELESHWIPFSEASGNVVIAGLGMAMIVINLLHRGKCDSIVVLEHSQALIDALPNLLEGYTRELWNEAVDAGELTIIKADCKADLPLDKIAKAFGCANYAVDVCDYFYADIWPTIGTDEAVEDTQHMCAQLMPAEAYFWGQELTLAHMMLASPDNVPTPDQIIESIEKLDLPLSIRYWPEEELELYGQMIVATAVARSFS